MKCYSFDGELYGIPRKLTIVDNKDMTFSIYWDALNMGSIYYVYDDDLMDAVWKSDDEFFKDCAAYLGDFIEVCKFEEED